MWLKFYCAILFILLAFASADNDEDLPEFRIVAPQVMCDTAKNQKSSAPPQITISMQTKGGQQLTYNLKIFASVIGGHVSQLHTVELWKNIRSLQTKINVSNRKAITESNQININNSELTAGVVYAFQIDGTDSNNKTSEPRNASLTFKEGGVLKQTNSEGVEIADDVSFIMLGSERMYSYMELVVEGEISFCNPQNDYKFQWEITNSPNEPQPLSAPGSTLSIPANSLKAGEKYLIKSTAMSINDSSVISSESLMVTIMKRGFDFQIWPTLVTIGVDRPFVVHSFYVDYDNTNFIPEVNWKCMDEMKNDCTGLELGKTFLHTFSFFSKGVYTITATISVNGVQKSSAIIITVDPDVIAVPNICSNIFRNVPVAGEFFELEAEISGLVPTCYAEWSTVKMDSYGFIDPALKLGNLSVINVEENFLSELVDYENNTMVKEVRMQIPSKMDKWNGLQPNMKYRFRLTMTCPMPIKDGENDHANKNVTSTMDLDVETNQPPVGFPLEILPTAGMALRTLFKFTTGLAKDKNMDLPVRYKFMYRVDRNEVLIADFYESTVAVSQLPYSEKPITTYYQACDSRSACSIVYGPEIKVTTSEMLATEFEEKISAQRMMMDRMEYSKFYLSAMTMGISFKNSKDTANLERLREISAEIILKEVHRLSEMPNGVSKADVLKFVQLSKGYVVLMGDMDNVVNELFGLIDDLLEYPEVSKNRAKRSTDDSRVKENPLIKQTILEYMDLIESQMNQSNYQNQTKLNFKNAMVNKMGKLCQVTPLFTREVLKSTKSTMSFYLKKINGSDDLRKQWAIDGRDNNDIEVQVQILPEGIDFGATENHHCVVSARYEKGVLSDTPIVAYEFYVIEVPPDGKANKMLHKNDTSNINLFLSFRKPNPDKNSTSLECQVWNSTNWVNNLCNNISEAGGRLNCKCKNLGYFRMAPKNLNTTSTLMEPPTSGLQIPPTTALSIITNGSNLPANTISPPIVSTNLPTNLPNMATTQATVLSTATPIMIVVKSNESVSSASTPIPSGALNHTSSSTHVQSSSVAGYTIAIVILLLAIVTIIGVYLYNRRNKHTVVTQELGVLSKKHRTPSDGVEYARFHDEDFLSGTNIQTIATT